MLKPEQVDEHDDNENDDGEYDDDDIHDAIDAKESKCTLLTCLVYA